MDIKDKPILAIIVPSYNEEEILNRSAEILLNILTGLITNKKISERSFISYVDDGSSDKTWFLIKELSYKYQYIKGIQLAYNMGHQLAMTAGICENNADIYITLDCDLQDDVSVIEKMVDKWLNNDIDVIYGIRSSREIDSFGKKTIANIYYFVIKLLGNKCIRNHADFRLISDNVAKIIRNVSAKNIYLRGFIYNLGLKSDKIYYSRAKRIGGKPKYTIFKLSILAFDGFIEFSDLPVYFIFLMFLLYLILSILNLSVIYGVISLNFFILGLISIYVKRIYTLIKTKKKYVISEKLNS